MISQHFGLEGPDPSTPFRDLGAMFATMLTSIDNVLHEFDYNGADPDLVLARTAALEARATALEAELDARRLASGHASGPTISAGQFEEVSISFPTGRFTDPPTVIAQLDTTALARRKVTYLYVHDVTATGFQLRIYNDHPTAAFAVAADWIASSI